MLKNKELKLKQVQIVEKDMERNVKVSIFPTVNLSYTPQKNF